MNILEIYNSDSFSIVNGETNIIIHTDNPNLVARPRDKIIDSILCIIKCNVEVDSDITFKVVQ